MIKVLVADDHHLVREGLKRLIGECADIFVVDEAVNGDEVLQKSQKGGFDVMVLDVSMPGPGFLDVMRRVRNEENQIRILVLSMYPESQYAVRAMRAGADGYLTKDHSPEELVEAIRRVHAGGKYVTSTLAERLAVELETDRVRLKHELLSDREYDVLCKLGSGKSVKEISLEMYLSPKTVSTYRTRILHKMMLNSTAELIRYTIEHQLVV